MPGLTRWDPFRELFTLQNEMDRFLNNAFRVAGDESQNGSSFWTPPLDVWETEDGYVVVASLPGVEPENVDIKLVNHTLTIQGQVQQAESQGQPRLRERQYGNFYRSLQLPATVDSDQIEANYYNGVLTLQLPKAEEAKPKRIPVHGNGQGARATGQRMIQTKPS
jgi:HSP20 family protein